MSAEHDAATPSRIGQRANPHPSGDPCYVTKVIDERDGEVRVAYVEGSAAAWWITDEAWDGWRRLGPCA